MTTINRAAAQMMVLILTTDIVDMFTMYLRLHTEYNKLQALIFLLTYNDISLVDYCLDYPSEL